MAGRTRNRGGVVGSAATAGATRNCMIWPVLAGSAASKSPAAPRRRQLVRPQVAQHVVARRDVGEVDDEVGPLGQAQQQPVVVGGGQVDRRSVQEAALVADLPPPHGMWLKSRIRNRDWQPLRTAAGSGAAPPSGMARCCR